MDAQAQAASDRAWRHFQLHAEQRIAVFNFFVASSGLLLTGLAYVLAGAADLWWLGVAAGALISLLAFVFWKLDQRSSQLIRVSEAEIQGIEAASVLGASVFSAVEALPTASSLRHVRSVWTFGRSFRLLFLAVGLLGLAGAGASVWKGYSRPAASETRRGDKGSVASGVGRQTAPAPPSSTPSVQGGGDAVATRVAGPASSIRHDDASKLRHRRRCSQRTT